MESSFMHKYVTLSDEKLLIFLLHVCACIFTYMCDEWYVWIKNNNNGCPSQDVSIHRGLARKHRKKTCNLGRYRNDSSSSRARLLRTAFVAAILLSLNSHQKLKYTFKTLQYCHGTGKQQSFQAQSQRLSKCCY